MARDIPPFPTRSTLAWALDASPDTITDWARKGIIPPPCSTLGARERWDWDEVQRHIKRQKIPDKPTDPIMEAVRGSEH